MMQPFGFGHRFWLGTVIWLVLLLAWLILEIIALVSLRKEKLHSAAQAVWALVILAVPLMGAIAYFIVQPHEPQEA